MVVLVIGMHRSGTSLISRSMKVFGIEHGNQLLTGIDNAKGHWEDLDLLSMNDLLLGHLGKTWSAMSMISAQEIEQLLSSELRIEAVRLIESKVEQCEHYGFKDPRTTLLLPFWQQILADCNLKPVYLFVVRQPYAVFESLSKRNRFEALRSSYLWLNYNLSALSYLQQCRSPVSVVDYSELLAFPAARLRSISAQTGLPLNEDELQIFANDFLDQRLDHSTSSLDKACADLGSMVPLVDVIYQFLVQMIDSPELLRTSAAKQLLQSWSSQLMGLQALLRLADDDFQRAEAAETAALAAQSESRKIRHELSIIHNSTSWRLTAPLRWLKDLLHSR